MLEYLLAPGPTWRRLAERQESLVHRFSCPLTWGALSLLALSWMALCLESEKMQSEHNIKFKKQMSLTIIRRCTQMLPLGKCELTATLRRRLLHRGGREWGDECA